LYEELKDVRRELAGEENLAPYIILSDATLKEMATYLPQSLEQLSQISGFGELKLEKYGQEFLTTVKAFCSSHHLSSRMALKAVKKAGHTGPERETNTMRQSYTLFREGHSVNDIAALRKISPATVEGHLAFYIERGSLDVEQLVDPKRVRHIRQAIEEVGGRMLSPVKNRLGENYSWTEIRYVMASTKKSKISSASGNTSKALMATSGYHS
jgi:ATP-dependent DNA helicase RecQ